MSIAYRHTDADATHTPGWTDRQRGGQRGKLTDGQTEMGIEKGERQRQSSQICMQIPRGEL